MNRYVADFTPEQLRNASAGRRYGQRKREGIMMHPDDIAAAQQQSIDPRRELSQRLAAAEAEIARLNAAIRDILDDVVGDDSDPLWIVDRDIVNAAAAALKEFK